MRYLLLLTVVINFIALILMGVGGFVILRKDVSPKTRAKLAPIMAVFFFLYCFLLIIFAILGAIIVNPLYLIFIPFALSPFIIGYFVRYNTIKRYTVYQILCMIATLFMLIFLSF